MNQHYEAANTLLQEAQGSGGSYLDPNTEGLMMAGVRAGLAGAYEQHTANLIAVLGWLPPAERDDALKEISERLGLA